MKKIIDFEQIMVEGGAEAVRHLLRDNPAAARAVDAWGYTPLHRAVANPELVALLLKGGASLEARNRDGQTALQAALEKNDESVRLLLAAGADPNVCDQQGNTPLNLAVMRGGPSVELLLEAGANPNLMNKRGESPLFQAIRNRNVELVEQLLRRGADATQASDDGWTALHMAARTGMEAASTRTLIELLLKAGADGEARNSCGDTPLLVAARGHWPEPLQVFLDPPLRARVDVRNHQGETPLHQLTPGRTDPARVLLAAGAEVDARDNEGNTPLIKVAHAAMGFASRALLAHGADVNASNHQGKTALHAAARQGSSDNVQLLLSAGANPQARDSNNQRPVDLAFTDESVLAMLEEATGEKSRRLRLGFVIQGRRRNQARVVAVHHRTPLLNVKYKLKLGTYEFLTYEKERRNWAFFGYHRFDDQDPAETMVARVNPYWNKVQPPDYDNQIVIGRWFAFVKADAGTNPAFLAWLGIHQTPLILPRLGVDGEGRSALDLRLDPFAQKSPDWTSLALVSTTRPVYAAGQEVVAIVLCLHPDGRRPAGGEVCLFNGPVEVPKTRQRLKLKDGLALARWKSLPEGHYRIILNWQGNTSVCEFNVGPHTLSLARAEWVEGPFLQDGQWNGRARLWLRGDPMATGVTVTLGEERNSSLAVTRDGGLVKVQLPAGDQSLQSLRVAWQDDCDNAAHLPLPTLDALEAGGVRLSTAASGDSVSLSGLHLSSRQVENSPLRLLSPTGEVARWEVLRDLEAVAVTRVFAGQPPQTLTFGPQPGGKQIEVDLSAASGTFGFLCVGALCQGEVFESLIPWARASTLSVECLSRYEVIPGETVRIQARVAGNPSSLCVIVEDARLQQNLARDGAERRLADLRRIALELEGPAPPLFSEAWLDGTFRARPGAKTNEPRPTSTMGTILVDLLESPVREIDPVKPTVRHTSTPAIPEEPPVVQTIFADRVKLRGGLVDIKFSAPNTPCTLAVHFLAVDTVRSSWATAGSQVAVKAPLEIWSDAVPQAMLPEDAGRVRGRLSIGCASGPVHLEATVDGQEVRFEDVDGPVVADPPRDLYLPLRPGLYQIRGSAAGHEVIRSFRVRPSDRVSERIRRLVLLKPGQSFRVEGRDRLHAVSITEPYEVLHNSGSALQDYRYQCCEQTAAAMLGAWATVFAARGRGQMQAWSSISRGLQRLDTLWRGDGFAFYEIDPKSNPVWGRTAYYHLLAMQVFRKTLSPEQAGAQVLDHLDRTVERCLRAYGSVPKGSIRDCYEAWLAPESRRKEVLGHVERSWKLKEGGLIGWVEVQRNLVSTRAESCYAAAVLLRDKNTRARHLTSIESTINWLGTQMRERGRFYSTPDSSALLALLTAFVQHIPQGGQVSIDGSPPLDLDQARAAVTQKMPREITCVEGRVPLMLDANLETRVELDGTDAFKVHFELQGAPVSEAPLGTQVDVVMDIGEYRPGLLAHFALPPCLALEEGAARLQTFQRDFGGLHLLRVPLRTIERSGTQSWHGVAALHNMFSEEDRWGQRIGFRVL